MSRFNVKVQCQGSKKGSNKKKEKEMTRKKANFERILQIEQKMQRKSSTIREFILITLIHIEERMNINPEIIIKRINKLFQCRAIVVATEKHQCEHGKHYHVGIWARDASKNTLRKKIREEFTEWTGRAIDISLHKAWGSICLYILKEDKEPIIWGEFTIDQIQLFAHAHEKKKGAQVEIGNLDLLRKLEQIEDWYQVYRDEILANRVLQSLPRMKEAFEDLKILKDIETNVFTRIVDYLQEKGNPREYDVEEIREKYLVIDWIACQLCFKRPIKTKQLFIYGEPSTQKTLLMNLLAKVIKIYFASSRRNDFAGANDYYDLWVFDEFHEQEQQEDPMWNRTTGATEEGSAFVNNLLKVLDGQECRLDSKYSRIFKKKKNVPIIMIANKLPRVMERHGPFRARFFRVRFSNQKVNLEEGRVIATLWGCLLRRISKSPYFKQRETPSEVELAYNGSNALIVLIATDEIKEKTGKKEITNEANQWENAIQQVENPIKERGNKEKIETILRNEAMLITKEGEFFKIKPKIIRIKEEYNIIIFEILKLEEEQWEEDKKQICLLDFASIPIKKKEEEKENEKSTLRKIFSQLEEEKNQHEQEKKESEEEEELDNIKRLNSIFLDNKEREWIRKETQRGYGRKQGMTTNEEAWSVISIQRAKNEKEQDYAMWPIEIKIFGKNEMDEENKEKTKVFPAVIRNIRKGASEEEEIINMYQKAKKLLENGERNEKIEIATIKCEISLARNGEKQPWNIEC